MADKIDDDERTNAVGLFNTARSYWRSAEHLNAAGLKVTHPQAPVTFLLCHAIELYLKAYLRGNRNSVAALKKIGHHLADLTKSAAEIGLKLEPEQSEILSHVDDADVAIEARYIVTGFKNRPTNEALSSVAAQLDQAVCDALIRRGFPLRSETFPRPAPPQQHDEIGEDECGVLLHLFGAEPRDRSEVIMAASFGMERGMIRYRLDRLKEVNFAFITASGRRGDTYWNLTSEGRRYVVEKLIKV